MNRQQVGSGHPSSGISSPPQQPRLLKLQWHLVTAGSLARSASRVPAGHQQPLRHAAAAEPNWLLQLAESAGSGPRIYSQPGEATRVISPRISLKLSAFQNLSPRNQPCSPPNPLLLQIPSRGEATDILGSLTVSQTNYFPCLRKKPFSRTLSGSGRTIFPKFQKPVPQ